jgi:NADH-quinone oxidoreductase subunit G
MRVVPLENEAVNECWLSDKDRFSYEGLNSQDRLTRPLLRRDGQLVDTDWQTALEYAAAELVRMRKQYGADAVGALVSPHSTLEELHLAQKLIRGLGSDNIDFRLRQADFSVDAPPAGAPWLGMSIAEFRLRSIACWSSAASCATTIRCSRTGCARRPKKARSFRCCTRATTIS